MKLQQLYSYVRQAIDDYQMIADGMLTKSLMACSRLSMRLVSGRLPIYIMWLPTRGTSSIPLS